MVSQQVPDAHGSAPAAQGEIFQDDIAAEWVKGVDEGIVVMLEPFEERGLVTKVAFLLQVGTFSGCKKGCSLHSHSIICKHTLPGSR
jgi:hypothetical protein